MAKCFDRLEHQAIFGSLRYFNFGENIIKWIPLFYNKFMIRTQNFGILSERWTKHRGTNQGCPLSPGLYLLTAEILANKLRQHKDIKGIDIDGVKFLISQFADDTDLYLSFDQNTINATFSVLSDIEKNTGLLVSYEKTTLYRIGSLAGSNAKLFTPRKVVWAENYINTLGIDISNDCSTVKDNIVKVTGKMQAIANMWYFRNMTLTGKVNVINSLMASLFVYSMQVTPVLREKDIKSIENIIHKFLWKGKKAKMSMAHLKVHKSEGGLGLVDIKSKHEALLYNWIVDCKRYNNIKTLAQAFLGKSVTDDVIWKCNMSYKDSKMIFVGDTFWHELIHRWHGFNHHIPQNRETVGDQLIVYNSHIKVRGKVLTNDKWCTDYVMNIRDILNVERNGFLSYAELSSKFNTSITWLEYASLISAIPEHWKWCLRTPGLIDSEKVRYNMIT